MTVEMPNLTELIAKPVRTTLGLMSGTSMDGLDIACCEVDIAAGTLRTTCAATTLYPAPFKDELSEVVQSGRADLRQLVALSTAWGQYAASAIEGFLADNNVTPGDIDLIGSHGQTVIHLPPSKETTGTMPSGTLQLGEAEVIAKRLGVTTVSDFRTADIAVGGGGAPLAPIYHQQRFADPTEDRLVVNIGGIANVTILLRDGSCRATDTGPGNCLIDYLMQTQLGKPFDEDGAFAEQGSVDRRLLEKLKSDDLFKRDLPFSLDRTAVLGLIDRYNLIDEITPESVATIIATVTELTAWAIHHQSRRLIPETPARVLVGGGGRFNNSLMKHLRNYFSGSIVSGTETLGSDPRFVEAECFAWLANLTLAGQAGNLPQVTGAQRPVVLGKISLP